MASGANEERPDGDRRTALALENDLFFSVKVTDILKRGGFQTHVARNAADFQRLMGGGGFAVALVNASARGVDWQACIAHARAAGLPVVAYASHVDVATQAAARAAGATRVIANSRLAELARIVERVTAQAQSPDAAVEADDDAEPGAGDVTVED